jgi:hypothetical protein
MTADAVPTRRAFAEVEPTWTHRWSKGESAQPGASAAAATLPEAIVDSSALSTDGDATMRAASQSRPKPKRAGAAAASGAHRSLASTKQVMLIGMLKRAEGASVTEM